jgi:2-iminobutanoate/2-iminopropanoate deaminase
MSLTAGDTAAIVDVVTRADAAASRRDAAAYADLFTADAVLDGDQGRHAGAALRSSVGPIWAAEGPATLHLTLNPVVDAGASPDEALVSSLLLIIDLRRPISIQTAAAITQTLRRSGGIWRISRRTVADPAPALSDPALSDPALSDPALPDPAPAAAELTRLVVPGLRPPAGAYSHVVVHGGLAYCSGQLGVDPATGAVVPGAGPQTRQALSNLALMLAAAGTSMDRVIRAGVFLRDQSMFAAMDEVFGEVFAAARPARTTVPGLSFRAGADVEIDLIAALP